LKQGSAEPYAPHDPCLAASSGCANGVGAFAGNRLQGRAADRSRAEGAPKCAEGGALSTAAAAARLLLKGARRLQVSYLDQRQARFSRSQTLPGPLPLDIRRQTNGPPSEGLRLVRDLPAPIAALACAIVGSPASAAFGAGHHLGSPLRPHRRPLPWIGHNCSPSNLGCCSVCGG